MDNNNLKDDRQEKNRIDCRKVKLVVWDLDDTFWRGTLSEGGVTAVPGNTALLKELTQRGIVNAVCSKNDKDTALDRLREMGAADYFVFPSINWEPKGVRIRELIRDMKLREENVLFLDDNPVNLNEALYYNPELMTGMPEDIGILEAYVRETAPSDPEGKRLQSYRVLEKKREEQINSVSNEEFLRNSNIKVSIQHECMQEAERITELIRRTNQLNYTKRRLNQEEVQALLQEERLECGYVNVQDKYGDYGIVGFYALAGRELKHFLFSCRTLGMGVEQYVYAVLGYPELTVAGEVAAPLRKDVKPDWINQEKELKTEGRQQFSQGGRDVRILFKGPCDLNAIFAFIEEADTIDCEFTYVSQKTGVTIEQISHTDHMVQALTLSEEQKRRVIEELPFGDVQMYSDRMFTGGYDVICISSLVDSNLGVYERRETGERVAFAEGYYPLTERENWEKYCRKEIYTSGCNFTESFLREFARKYRFAGINGPQRIAENIRFIREQLPERTLLVILLGAELSYDKNKLPAYTDRHLVQKRVNDELRKLSQEYRNIACVDVNRHLTGQESFYDQFNHFVPQVYYGISGELLRVVRDWTGLAMHERSRYFMYREALKDNLRKIKKKMLKK